MSLWLSCNYLKSTSIPEVGVDSVLYVAPDRVDSIAAEINRVTSNKELRENLVF